mgnify:CR=1 FL=1
MLAAAREVQTSFLPARMPRAPGTRRAAGFANLYPVGEGAGYAGGIMSAALDGADPDGVALDGRCGGFEPCKSHGHGRDRDGPG